MHIQYPLMPIQYQGTLFMHQTLKGSLVFLHCCVNFLINFKLIEFYIVYQLRWDFAFQIVQSCFQVKP